MKTYCKCKHPIFNVYESLSHCCRCGKLKQTSPKKIKPIKNKKPNETLH